MTSVSPVCSDCCRSSSAHGKETSRIERSSETSGRELGGDSVKLSSLEDSKNNSVVESLFFALKKIRAALLQ